MKKNKSKFKKAELFFESYYKIRITSYMRSIKVSFVKRVPGARLKLEKKILLAEICTCSIKIFFGVIIHPTFLLSLNYHYSLIIIISGIVI